MNIFVLHRSPDKAAQMQCDKHVVKMTLETAQLLSTVQQLQLDNPSPDFYRPTHKNHPCSIWARSSTENYRWLYEHFEALAKEYEFRYGKKHKSWLKLARPLMFLPDIPKGELTDFAQAMPEQYKNKDSVKAYRDYYCGEKSSIAKWTKRKKPNWYLT